MSLFWDFGGVLLTILLVPLFIIGLLVLLIAGLINECSEFFLNIPAFRN